MQEIVRPTTMYNLHHKLIWIFLLSGFFIGRFAIRQQISPSVRIRHGAVNGVFIESNGKDPGGLWRPE